jgi:hypothetical protein
MKAITSIFESILGQDDAVVWTPAEGPTEAAAGPRGTSWGWGS